MPSGRSAIHYGGIPLKDGVFAVVETATVEKTVMVRSDLMTPVAKEVELTESGKVAKRMFYLADTEAFMDPCCVIPDIGGPPNRYFVVKPRNEWAQEFTRWIQDHHTLDHMDALDKVEDEETSGETSCASSEEDGPKRKRKIGQR